MDGGQRSLVLFVAGTWVMFSKVKVSEYPQRNATIHLLPPSPARPSPRHCCSTPNIPAMPLSAASTPAAAQEPLRQPLRAQPHPAAPCLCTCCLPPCIRFLPATVHKLPARSQQQPPTMLPPCCRCPILDSHSRARPAAPYHSACCHAPCRLQQLPPELPSCYNFSTLRHHRGTNSAVHVLPAVRSSPQQSAQQSPPGLHAPHHLSAATAGHSGITASQHVHGMPLCLSTSCHTLPWYSNRLHRPLLLRACLTPPIRASSSFCHSAAGRCSLQLLCPLLPEISKPRTPMLLSKLTVCCSAAAPACHATFRSHARHVPHASRCPRNLRSPSAARFMLLQPHVSTQQQPLPRPARARPSPCSSAPCCRMSTTAPPCH